MPEAQEPVAAEPAATETDAPVVQGTEVDESTTTPEPAEPVDYKAVAEEREKELNKARMELNQRKNREKELEKAREEAERKRIEQESDAAVQAEFYRKKLEEKEAAEAERAAEDERKEQQKQVEEFRDKIIADYPPEVQKLAKQLGTNWDDAADYGAAETQLRAKLDVLQSAITGAGEEEPPATRSNNPRPGEDLTELDKLKTLSAADMRKVLPVATPR